MQFTVSVVGFVTLNPDRKSKLKDWVSGESELSQVTFVCTIALVGIFKKVTIRRRKNIFLCIPGPLGIYS